MSYFQYAAQDNSGKPVAGTIQAGSTQEATAALQARGFRVLTLTERGVTTTISAPVASQPAPVRPAQVPAPRPQAVSQPVIRPVAAPAPTPALQVVRTARGKDSDRFFLFSQLAAAFRSGMNPAQVFNDVAHRAKPHFGVSLTELANASANGRSIADTMARFPDLYPESAVGMVRAGEMGGFLPDAFEALAQQSEQAHKFRRFFWWVSLVAMNAFLLIPGMIIVTRGYILAWQKFSAGSGNENATAVVFQAFGEKLLWPVGPVMLLILAVYFAVRHWLSLPRSQMFRHRLGLRIPVYGPRARHECLTIFTWTMSRLSKAGISPARSFEVGASAVPNLAMRDALRAMAPVQGEATKLSDLIHRSGAFPEEYAPVIATAEYTGDIPGALDRLSQMSRTEYEAATTYAKIRASGWGCLAMFVASGIALALLMGMWYWELPRTILKDFDMDW